MQHEPRHTQADANFIEMGGLKSWGCYAFVVSVLVLLLLFVLVHVLLAGLMGDPLAWWASLLVLIGVTTGAVFLWIRRRQGRGFRRTQE